MKYVLSYQAAEDFRRGRTLDDPRVERGAGALISAPAAAATVF